MNPTASLRACVSPAAIQFCRALRWINDELTGGLFPFLLWRWGPPRLVGFFGFRRKFHSAPVRIMSTIIPGILAHVQTTGENR